MGAFLRSLSLSYGQVPPPASDARDSAFSANGQSFVADEVDKIFGMGPAAPSPK